MRTRLSPRARAWLLLALVFGYAFLVTAYFVLRYAGHWAETDTGNLTMAARGILQEGRLASKDLYFLGFAYPALTTTLASVAGLSIAQLQLLVFPLVSACLALLAFVTYRELIGDLVAAALGTLLLFMQPDFLFVILRGSHEKLTWLFEMLALFLLARSLRAAYVQRSARFAAFVGLFYLAVYGLVASNAFFGSSFILAVGMSLLGGLLILLRTRRRANASGTSRAAVTRLIYVVVIAMVIWVMHIFYLYQPAIRFLTSLTSSAERVRAVALGDAPAIDPYATVAWGWVSRPAYLALVIPTFTVAGLSFVAWTLRGIGYWRGRGRLADESGGFLAWLLYAGFGLQILASVIVGASGGPAANLQLRLLPAMMVLGVPFVSKGLTQLWQTRTTRQGRRWMTVALVVFVLWMGGASLLKMTNDPALSNYWMFCTKPEAASVAWSDSHLQFRSIWVGLDGSRLRGEARIAGVGSSSGNVFDAAGVDILTRDIIVSSIERDASLRRSEMLPDVRDENRVYDNGSVAQYHLRPRTPYQK